MKFNNVTIHENWEKIFSFIFDIFLFICDLFIETKIPLTNVSIGVFVLFFLFLDLLVFMIHGTNTNFNKLGSQFKDNSSNIVYLAYKGTFKKNKKERVK